MGRGIQCGLRVNGTRIADDTRCYVIAELGHNHQGCAESAGRLVRAAAAAGAHAVKLQKRHLPDLYAPSYYARPYSGPHAYGTTYGEHREALELPIEAFERLRAEAHDLGMGFVATGFDATSIDQLVELGVDALKIASGDVRSHSLLRYAQGTGAPILLSTGGSELADVKKALELLARSRGGVAVLQCTSIYPCPPSELALGVIAAYMRLFPECVVGWSAHDVGTEFAPIAYALGARIIEKHFTLDRTLPGSDHALSLEPADLAKMTQALETAYIAIGDGTKRLRGAELPAVQKLGKKLVAARHLPVGHVLEHADLDIRSPGDAVWPSQIDDLVGCVLVQPATAGEAITLDMVGRRP